MDTWQFYQNERGQWCWKHVAVGGEMREGKHCFDSRTDCIVDAMAHGYLAAAQARPRAAGRSALVARTQSAHVMNPLIGPS
jgi:hypothetical protein